MHGYCVFRAFHVYFYYVVSAFIQIGANSIETIKACFVGYFVFIKGIDNLMVARENGESKWNAVTIHKQSHLNNRRRPVLFRTGVLAYTGLYFAFKEEVCAIIKKNSAIAFGERRTIFI